MADWDTENGVEIPTSMSASVLTAQGQIGIESRPVPTAQAGEVLIRILSVGVCGSDVHYFEHGRIGPFVVEAPLVLGHEASGQIVGVGPGVDKTRIGKRVSIEPQRPCRVCDFCKSGAYNLCPSMEFMATPPVDGAFVEYVTVLADFAFDVPDSVSDDSAALMEPLSVGIAAAQKGGIKVGDRVLISGGGPIGVISAQVARAFGASEIIVTDILAPRRELALRFGATRVIDPLTESLDGLDANVFIDASGAEPAILAGIRATRSRGTVVLVGSAEQIALSVPEVAMRELNITGIFRYTGTWPIARNLVETGQVLLDPLVTHHYGLEQVEEALAADGSTAGLKRMIVPGVARIAQAEVRNEATA